MFFKSAERGCCIFSHSHSAAVSWVLSRTDHFPRSSGSSHNTEYRVMETEKKIVLRIWTRDQKSFLTKVSDEIHEDSIIEIRSKFPLDGNWCVLFHGALQHLFLAARRAHKFAAQRWLHSVRAAKSLLWETSGGSSSEGAMFKRINVVDAGDSEKRFLSAFYQSALNKFWVSRHGLDLVFCRPVTRRRQRAASGINH